MNCLPIASSSEQESRDSVLICKGSLEQSNSWKAQGGIASVIGKADSFESHIKDTLSTGCGINDEKVVDLVVRKGPELIRQLLDWGTEFDTDGKNIATTLEGGHSYPRVAHAHGDKTGKIITETLFNKARQNPNIKIIYNFFAIDLLTNTKNECAGLIGQDSR
ncbi:MAG: FAD-binding protein, partial [Planctomycetota bacterium]